MLFVLYFFLLLVRKEVLINTSLRLVFAVQKFLPYIDGAKTIVITDHVPLKSLLHRRDLTGRLAKYQIAIQKYDITRTYRPGKSNMVCDALSRHLPINHTDIVINTVTSQLFTLDKVCEEQQNCSRTSLIRESLQVNPNNPAFSNYFIANNILYYVPMKINQDPVIVLPDNSSLRTTLIKQIHSSQMGMAHLGVRKTLTAVSKIAIWNKMTHDVTAVVSQCPHCQKRKDPNAYRINEPLCNFDLPVRPWERIHSDVIGPLPQTLDGNKFIIVFVDAFSKYIVAEPIPDQKALTIINTFMNRFVSRFGPPALLVTDQGTNFMRDIFRSTLKNLKIAHKTSTPYHHESNGQVERANRTIEELISMAIATRNDEWDNVMFLAIHAYNCAENSTTKHSPYTVIHGYEPFNIFRNSLELPVRKFASETDYANQLTPMLRAIWKTTQANLEIAQQEQKRHYDLRNRTQPSNLQIGQQVLVRQDIGNKIAPRFQGPFVIVDIDRPNITILDGRRERAIHMNRVKLYNSDGE